MSSEKSTNESVLLVVEQSVATITLNQPPRNTMTLSLLDSFAARLEDVRQDTAVRALVVRSHGRHFCAGAELQGGMPGRREALGGVQGTADQLRAVYKPFLNLLRLPIPTVASVQGGAVGGGLGLAVACDFRIVSPSTKFLAPFSQLGIHPGMGLTHLLPRLIGPSRAMEMLIRGRGVRGEEAVHWGLASQCVEESSLFETATSWAKDLAEKAPAVVRWTKQCVHQSVGMDPTLAADREALAQALTFQSHDAAEGLAAFLEKRNPSFTGE